MTVSELIRNLREFDPNLLVVVASDEEGNDYRMASGDFGIGRFNRDDRDFYSEGEDCDPDEVNALVIWPE